MKRNRAWTHKSVRALIQSAGGGDPVEIIRSKAKEIVRWAKEMGWSGPPYNPRDLASLRGIRSKESANLFSAEAQLTPMDGEQLLLEFNPNRCLGRRNYSISHELAHTLFDDCFEMVHQRRTDKPKFDPDQEVESLCQIGAAEFLMPEEDFIKDLKEHRFSLESVLPLMELYKASREAVARRILSLSSETAALAFFSERLKPSEMNDRPQHGEMLPQPKMRILYSVHSDDFPVYLPRHKSAPDSSCIYTLDQTDEVVSAIECWGLEGETEYFVEAMALPVPDSDDHAPTVMALIQPIIDKV